MSELPERDRYSIDEAAQHLSVTLVQLDDLMAEGRLICRADGASVYFEHADLAAYLASLSDEGAA